MEGKGTSRDLLGFERKDLSSSSSALEKTLLLCKEKKKSEEAPTSRPTIGPVPKSQFHDKLKGFLGIMAESNKKLEEEAKDNPDVFKIEAVTVDEPEDDSEDESEEESEEESESEEDKAQFIEMDLMLGVADLKTPEAVKAAEAAIAGNGLARDSSSIDEDKEEKKRTKIIELS